MKNPGANDWEVEKRFAIIGAILGPVFLYIAGAIFRDADNAYSFLDYFWSIPGGALTGYLLPSAWPEKKDWPINSCKRERQSISPLTFNRGQSCLHMDFLIWRGL